MTIEESGQPARLIRLRTVEKAGDLQPARPGCNFANDFCSSATERTLIRPRFRVYDEERTVGPELVIISGRGKFVLGRVMRQWLTNASIGRQYCPKVQQNNNQKHKSRGLGRAMPGPSVSADDRNTRDKARAHLSYTHKVTTSDRSSSLRLNF